MIRPIPLTILEGIQEFIRDERFLITIRLFPPLGTDPEGLRSSEAKLCHEVLAHDFADRACDDVNRNAAFNGPGLRAARGEACDSISVLFTSGSQPLHTVKTSPSLRASATILDRGSKAKRQP